MVTGQHLRTIPDWIREAPKIVLHDHLDGGVRPGTLAELADQYGYAPLAGADPDTIIEHTRGWGRGGLVGYLEAFTHTTAVLQTPEALVRVAREAAIDLAADRTLYAELRFAPELAGADLDETISAVCEGLDSGEADAAALGTPIVCRVIVTALRDRQRSVDVAQAAVRAGGRVVGFDLAGAENGWRASAHIAAIRTAIDGGLGFTCHAGEADVAAGIRDALDCGAVRIGHGVAAHVGLDNTGRPRRGSTLARCIDQRIPFEICPSSNLHTGVVEQIADHPLEEMRRAGAVITINSDNRLMSATSTSAELAVCAEAFGWGPAEVAEVIQNAARAAFCDTETRAGLLTAVGEWSQAVTAGPRR